MSSGSVAGSPGCRKAAVAGASGSGGAVRFWAARSCSRREGVFFARVTGAKGLKLAVSAATGSGRLWAAFESCEFSGARVEISSEGPKFEAEVEAGVEGGAGAGVFFRRYCAWIGCKFIRVEVGVGGVCIEIGCKCTDVEVGVVVLGCKLLGIGVVGGVEADVAGEFVGEVGAEHGAGVFDEAAEAFEGSKSALRQEAIADGGSDGVPGGGAGRERHALERFHGGLADAAGWASLQRDRGRWSRADFARASCS